MSFKKIKAEDKYKYSQAVNFSEVMEDNGGMSFKKINLTSHLLTTLLITVNISEAYISTEMLA